MTNFLVSGDSWKLVTQMASRAYVRGVETVWRVRFDELFDRELYRIRYPEVSRAGYDPVFHFLIYGAKENRIPHSEFDTAFYLSRYPDVAKSRLNPLLHYLRFGQKEGRQTKAPIASRNFAGQITKPNVSHKGSYNAKLDRNPFSQMAIIRKGAHRELSTKLRVSFRVDEPIIIQSGRVCLEGWCFVGEGLLPRKIVTRIGDTEISAYLHQPRQDVAAAVQDSRVVDSGFVFTLDREYQGAKLAVEAILDDGTIVSFDDIRLPRNSGLVKHRQPGKFRDYDDYVRFDRDYQVDNTRNIEPASIKISLLLPTYNSNLYFLSRCIHSIQEQRYSNWELSIADDKSEGSELHDYLTSLSQADERVKVTFRSERGHISAALNSAFSQASGDYAAFIDHDDELHPDALFELASLITEKPKLRLIYTDEDKIDYHGRRMEPAFKPGFDIDVLRAFDYLGHLICVKKSLLDLCGGFRNECIGAQDWDLLVRIVEQLDRDEIGHISKPLYHWRKHLESTAMTLDAKPYVRKAWKRALQDHAANIGGVASVEPGLFDGSMRLRYDTKREARATIITTGGFDGKSTLSLLGNNFPFQVSRAVACDAGGIRFLGRLDSQQCVRSPSECDTDVFLFISRPLEAINHWFIEELISNALRPDCAAAAPVIASSDGKIVEAGFFLGQDGQLQNVFAAMDIGSYGYLGLAKVTHRTAVPSGICLAISAARIVDSKIFEEMGNDDPELVLSRLAVTCVSKQGRLLVTPYAIATLPGDYASVPEVNLTRLEQLVAKVPEKIKQQLPQVNPNMERFTDPQSLWAYGFK